MSLPSPASALGSGGATATGVLRRLKEGVPLVIHRSLRASQKKKTDILLKSIRHHSLKLINNI